MSWDCKIAIEDESYETILDKYLSFVRSREELSCLVSDDSSLIFRTQTFNNVCVFDLLFEGEDHDGEYTKQFIEDWNPSKRAIYFLNNEWEGSIFAFFNDGHKLVDYDLQNMELYANEAEMASYNGFSDCGTPELIESSMEESETGVGPIYNLVRILMPELIISDSSDEFEIRTALLGELSDTYYVEISSGDATVKKLDRGEYDQDYEWVEYNGRTYTSTYR